MRARIIADPAWQTMPADYLENMRFAAPVTRTPANIVELLREEFAAPSPDRTTYRLKRAEDLTEVEPPDYLIKGFFAPGELSVIYGEPGCGKSFLATYLSYSCALAQPVFDRRTKVCPVLYVALEGEIGFERRLQALKERAGGSASFFYLTQPADIFGREPDIQGLIAAAILSDAELIIIDTFARAMGAGSENEGRDMAIMIANLDHIRRETGAHVCVVHHCGKDAARGMRGHSSLLGALDVALEVKRDDDIRTVRLVKAKDGRDGDEHAFTLEVIELGRDDDGDPITTCVVVPCDDAAPAARTDLGGAAGIALKLLRKALDEAGNPAPSTPHIPSGTRTITPDLWRSYCYQGTITDSTNPDTRQKAFVRASQTLQSRGFIGVWGDHVWLK